MKAFFLILSKIPLQPLILTAKTRQLPVIFLILMILGELLLVSISLDARSLLETNQPGIASTLLAYSGDLAKLAVLFVVVVGIALGERLRGYAVDLVAKPHPHRLRLLGLHCVFFVTFLYLSFFCSTQRRRCQHLQ